MKIIEETCYKPPEILESPGNPVQDRKTIEQIIQHFKEHPNKKEMKKCSSTKEPIKFFSFPEIPGKNINKLLRSLKALRQLLLRKLL